MSNRGKFASMTQYIYKDVFGFLPVKTGFKIVQNLSNNKYANRPECLVVYV